VSTTRRNVLFAAAAPPAAARALSMRTLAALNPSGAKARMLYTRRSRWNGRPECGVSSSLLVAATNATASAATPGAVRHHLPQLALEESP
jgi:hypothetical protein